MNTYMLYGTKLIANDATLKEFASSLYNNLPVEDLEIPEDSEDRKTLILEMVEESLNDDISRTDIDYGELLYKYRGELGDLFYQMWDRDYAIPEMEFLGEGAQKFFNDIVYYYISIHYDEFNGGAEVISLNENMGKYHYWSNSCGETHHWGQYDITPEQLPKQLKRVYDELFWENRFGLNCYLAEYAGEYGISLEVIYNTDWAADTGLSYDRLVETAQEKANMIAQKFPHHKVLCGKDICEWNDGSKESIMAVFLSWNVSKDEYERVGNFVNGIVYN